MDPKDTVTISSLENLTDDFDIGNYTNTALGDGASVTISSPNVFSLGNTTSPYTISSGAGVTAINSPWATYNPAPKIRLDGEGADIEVNGWSLIDSIRRIEERLNILTPNDKLEEEWEELRELGEQYRKLEQHIKDKQSTWNRLKAMPKVDID
jgi:hypothetical protein